MKQMMKLSVTLALYTVVACLALAAVNMLTSPRILAAKEAKTKLALQAIFPDADSFRPVIEGMPKSVDKIAFGDTYLAFNGDKPYRYRYGRKTKDDSVFIFNRLTRYRNKGEGRTVHRAVPQ